MSAVQSRNNNINNAIVGFSGDGDDTLHPHSVNLLLSSSSDF